MIVAVDTNVIITAYAWWDGRQDAAVRAINRFVDEKTLIVPVHALMESYSVLTSLPREYRATPAEAFRALQITFANVPVAGLSSDDFWPLLKTLVNRDISGGRIYDAAIAHVAREAGAEAILTFNARHFWGEGLQVLTP
ncbi:MAG TPA: PIN domain-containing protein [Thermoanaerobaculia bacterium]|nr:PIN domain-containing protein [Thermoanaerobaculia bacterium]